MTGAFIAFEGLDGVGKTTTSQALAEAMGGTWGTTPSPELRALRNSIDEGWTASPDARATFYAATVIEAGQRARAMADHGQVVVIDRYWLSTVAYARASGAAVDLDALAASVPPADITVWLDLSERERCARLHARGTTSLDRASIAYANTLRFHYRRGLASDAAGTVVHIATDGLSASEVLAESLARVRHWQSSRDAQLRLFPWLERRGGP